MVFGPGVATLRTDESFRRKDQEAYHKGTSPLEKLGTKMISQIPLDTMHLCYLGVMKRMMIRLFQKKQSTYTLRKEEIVESQELSSKILMYLPSEFKTKRGHKHLKFYKAKEYRRIALYDGYLLFKKLPHPELFRNFLLFACALRILSNPAMIPAFVDDAEILLKNFVKDSQKVYGPSFIVYNVHHLEHLSEDSRRHEITLEEMSCFDYENYLGKIKALLYAPGRTLPQIVCRLMERVAVMPDEEPSPKPPAVFEQPHFSGPNLSCRGEQFKKLETPDYAFQLNVKGAYCLTKAGDVVWIQNIVKTTNGKGLIIGQKFKYKSNYFLHPLPSSALDIFEVRELEPLEKWHVEDIKTKVVLLPVEPNAVVNWNTDVGLCLPMLHNSGS